MSIDYVKKLILKMGDNGKSEKWKLMNTKPCPKCKSPISKDGGCSHMTCSFPCCFQFCWFCLGDWKNVAAHYDCAEPNHNAHYDRVEYDESEDDRVERERNGEYYFEQWAANESCRERAVSDMQLIRELRVSLGLFDHQPWFERNAWLTIVKCRRVLKWAYAYQYYHAEDLANMKLLEFLKDHAEKLLKQLHDYAKKSFIFHQMSQQEYMEFRDKLIALTNVTADSLNNLIRECNLKKKHPSKKRRVCYF